MNVRRSKRTRKSNEELYAPDDSTPASVRHPKLRPQTELNLPIPFVLLSPCRIPFKTDILATHMQENNCNVENDSFSDASNTDDNSFDKDYDIESETETGSDTAVSSSDIEPETESNASTSSSDSGLFSKKRKIRKVKNTRNEMSIFESSETIDSPVEENEYRLQRQKSMQDRFKFFNELNFTEDIKELKSFVRPRPPRNFEKPKEKHSSERLVERSSLRLRNISQLLPSQFWVKDLDIPFIAVEDDRKTEALKTLQEDINLPFDGNCNFFSADFDKYSEVVKSCQMRYELPKMTERDIFSMDFHPSTKKLLILAGDVDGNITIQNIVKEDIKLQFKSHSCNVDCVSFSVYDHTKFYSTSHEGVTRLGDMNSSRSTLVYQAERGEQTTWHHEFGGSLLVAEDGGVVKLVDLRTPIDESVTFMCHSSYLRTVQSHPTNNNYFLTSSGVGTGEFGIFDIRTGNSEYPNPVVMQTFDMSLYSAFFSAQGNCVVCTCIDTVRVFDVSDLQTSTRISQMNRNSDPVRKISRLCKAKWQPGREDAFLVSSLIYPKRIQLYHRSGELIHQFLSDVTTPVIVAHPTQPIYVGGSERGKICVFSPFASIEEIYS